MAYKRKKWPCDREGIIVEASNQQGCALVVYPLRDAIDAGTVVNIENVTRWRPESDDVVPRDFVLTQRAEKGDRILHLYPPIEKPDTVNDLPMHGAAVTVKENRLIGPALCVRVPADYTLTDGPGLSWQGLLISM